jgi:hypothetical protein
MQSKNRHPTMRLTPALAKEIYALKGIRQGVDVALKYRVSPATVSLIWTKKIWRDIHGEKI